MISELPPDGVFGKYEQNYTINKLKMIVFFISPLCYTVTVYGAARSGTE